MYPLRRRHGSGRREMMFRIESEAGRLSGDGPGQVSGGMQGNRLCRNKIVEALKSGRKNAKMQETNNAQKSFRDLPGPLGLPFLGNLHQVRFERLHLILEEWAQHYGPLYRIAMGPRLQAVVSDPSAIRRMLSRRPHGFRRASPLGPVAEEMGLLGVFAAEGDDWRRQRRIVSSALNPERLWRFFPKLVRSVEGLRERWEGVADAGKPFDPGDDLMRFTVEVTMQLALGVDPGAQEATGPIIRLHLDKIFPVLHRRVNLPYPYWRWFRLPSDLALERALTNLGTQVRGMIRTARERMDADPRRRASPENFLEAVLAASEDGETGFSDAEIFANAVTLLLAGEDTTANTLAWTIHYFTKHPEHFARAREEVDRALAPAQAIETIEQTERLAFLDAFCEEVMRLRPVAPIIALEPIADEDVLGCRIPGGTPVLLLTRHAATRGGGSTRFEPERRPAPQEEAAFFPFGGGPRLCPGRNLALLEMRAVLAMLCRNFDVEPASPIEDVGERLSFTMAPANLFVRLRHRSGAPSS